MSWDDFDSVLARVEGRDESTGKNKPTKANVAARNGMRRLYAERIAKGLNAHGKPLKAAWKRNNRYGWRWSGLSAKIMGENAYRKQLRAWKIAVGASPYGNSYKKKRDLTKKRRYMRSIRAGLLKRGYTTAGKIRQRFPALSSNDFRG